MDVYSSGGQPALILPTEDPALVLRALDVGDLEQYYALLDRNRRHLTRHGDYGYLAEATLEDVRTRFLHSSGRNLRFGMWYFGQLIGRVDLDPIEPPRWVLGYWIDLSFTGRGIMASACRTLIRHARDLGATELYAGVTDGNEPSIRLLKRLGFEHLQDVHGRSRWRLPLIADPPPPLMVTSQAPE